MRKHDDDCLSGSCIYEWFKRFKEGREDLQDECSGRRKDVVNEKNAEKRPNHRLNIWNKNYQYPQP